MNHIGWPWGMATDEPAPALDADPENVLRLTGEQIASIDPPVDGRWMTDWDEYEDFVPARALLGSPPSASGGRDGGTTTAGDSRLALFDERIEANRQQPSIAGYEALVADLRAALPDRASRW